MTKRRKKTQHQLIDVDHNTVHISNYEVTFEPIHDRKYKRLPSHVKDAIDRLHYDSQSKPIKAIPALIEWIKKYPTANLHIHNNILISGPEKVLEYLGHYTHRVAISNYRIKSISAQPSAFE